MTYSHFLTCDADCFSLTFYNCKYKDIPSSRLVNKDSVMSKRTWQPKKLKRLRVHGFLKRMASAGGKSVIKARRAKGRKRLAATSSTK